MRRRTSRRVDRWFVCVRVCESLTALTDGGERWTDSCGMALFAALFPLHCAKTYQSVLYLRWRRRLLVRAADVLHRLTRCQMPPEAQRARGGKKRLPANASLEPSVSF